MTALILTTKISSATALQNEAEVEEAPFGDGYMGASTRLNKARQVWTVVWDDVSSTDAKTLKTFWRTNVGDTTITWTPPDEDTQFDFRITGNLGYDFKGGDARRVSMTLKQIFDDV